MPEGPQSILLKEQAELFTGLVVLKSEGEPNNFHAEFLIGQTLLQIKTFGKEVLFCFTGCILRIHLMLFGKYTINSELNRELRLGLEFETGTINFYACDCRLLPGAITLIYDWRKDVMSGLFDQASALKKLLHQPSRLICDALLDQNIVAGVGNAIKNEVLFRIHIHPESIVGEIPEPELRKLVQDCVTYSFKYLQWLRENTGEMPWLVYKQKICPRDYLGLRQEKLGKSKRSSYYCDKCQHLYLPENS